MDKDRVFVEEGDDASVESESKKRSQIESLTDSELLKYHAALHASPLIVDLTWAPLIAEEVLRRKLVDRN